MSKTADTKAQSTATECFVIMPIADHEGYDKGHFSKVYEDIFKPACIKSGFLPIRADEVKQTNLIHLDILQKLIESPMAICDLSARNPNVLFELGLRQAFDKPTVLVQECGTPKIFDIAPLRYTEYRRELRYREVLEDQDLIAQAVRATLESTSKGDGVNSIVRILSLSKPATLKESVGTESTGLLQLVRAEMSEMRSDFQRALRAMKHNNLRMDPRLQEDLQRAERMQEAASSLQQTEAMIGSGMPQDMIMHTMSRAQIIIEQFLNDDVSCSVSEKNEAQRLHTRFRDIEHRVMTMELL